MIGSGCTVTIDTAAAALNVSVSTGGTLQYEDTTARTLAVGANVTVDAGGTLQSAATGTQTGHILSVGANLVNAGTIDFSTNTDTAGASITFTGAANASLNNSGTLDLRTHHPEQGHERGLDARLPPRRDDHGPGREHGRLPDDRERDVQGLRFGHPDEPGLRGRRLHRFPPPAASG